MQFEAQDRHYRAHFPDARFDVIERGGVPIGRLYVDRSAEAIHILDIALLTEHRDAGAGSALLRDLRAEASASGRCVTIHVERTNPARRLYERLGFRIEGEGEDDPVYLFMVWRPEAPQANTAS